MIILNTGGTFNKIYDPIQGGLIVPTDNRAIEDFLAKTHQSIEVEGLIYKDSLEFGDDDRAKLVEAVKKCDKNGVVIVHGTDTMDRSAEVLAKKVPDKCVVLTGAMIPYSIDPTEASSNLTLSIAKVKFFPQNGVFIAMHGLVLPYDKIFKDRKRGIFCPR